MGPSRGVFVLDPEALEQALRHARRIAVLGIKPESRSSQDAYAIPLYLSEVGYEILPVPVRYPEAATILGKPVVRSLREIAEPVDIVSVFVRADQVPAHEPDIIALRPGLVWFQSGLLPDSTATALLAAGLPIAHECIGCRRALIFPSWAPLW